MKVYAGVTGARLPRWLLADSWPMRNGAPQLATLHFSSEGLQCEPEQSAHHDYLPLHGALVLPAFIEPHAHLDKTFTIQRSPALQPGLLAAITAMHQDRVHWSHDDLLQRARQALNWAAESGVSQLRTILTGLLPMRRSPGRSSAISNIHCARLNVWRWRPSVSLPMPQMPNTLRLRLP